MEEGAIDPPPKSALFMTDAANGKGETRMEGLSPSTLVRQKTIEFWRLRLEEAHERYETASAQYRRLLEEKPKDSMAGPDGKLAQARDMVSETLLEYSRLLRIFTQLTLNGTLPQEHEATGGNGGGIDDD
jgi:hypothetical protein